MTACLLTCFKEIVGQSFFTAAVIEVHKRWFRISVQQWPQLRLASYFTARIYSQTGNFVTIFLYTTGSAIPFSFHGEAAWRMTALWCTSYANTHLQVAGYITERQHVIAVSLVSEDWTHIRRSSLLRCPELSIFKTERG